MWCLVRLLSLCCAAYQAESCKYPLEPHPMCLAEKLSREYALLKHFKESNERMQDIIQGMACTSSANEKYM